MGEVRPAITTTLIMASTRTVRAQRPKRVYRRAKYNGEPKIPEFTNQRPENVTPAGSGDLLKRPEYSLEAIEADTDPLVVEQKLRALHKEYLGMQRSYGIMIPKLRSKLHNDPILEKNLLMNIRLHFWGRSP